MVKRILIVEDEQSLMSAIALKLKNENFEVLTADNVEDAMQLFDQNEVSLVWLDHYLKGEYTGLDMIAYVKGEKGNKDIPVLVITNTASMEDQYGYLKLGAEKYCVKTNYTLKELVEEVKKLVC